METYNEQIEKMSRHDLYMESMLQIDACAENPKCDALIKEWKHRDGNSDMYDRAWHDCMGWTYRS